MHIGRNSFISPQAIIEQPENVTIGHNVQIKPGVVLRPETGFIHIGNNIVINHYTVIHAKGGVEIADWTIIGPHCGLYAQNHSYDSFDLPITKQPNKGIGITFSEVELRSLLSGFQEVGTMENNFFWGRKPRNEH